MAISAADRSHPLIHPGCVADREIVDSYDSPRLPDSCYATPDGCKGLPTGL